MLGSKTCAVVIPCFNEGASIAALVAAVRQHLPCVMVALFGEGESVKFGVPFTVRLNAVV